MDQSRAHSDIRDDSYRYAASSLGAVLIGQWWSDRSRRANTDCGDHDGRPPKGINNTGKKGLHLQNEDYRPPSVARARAHSWLEGGTMCCLWSLK